MKKGEHILFIDDVVTDRKSKLEGVKPLLQDGGKVDTILVVIDREQGGKQNLEKFGISTSRRYKAFRTGGKSCNYRENQPGTGKDHTDLYQNTLKIKLLDGN